MEQKNENFNQKILDALESVKNNPSSFSTKDILAKISSGNFDSTSFLLAEFFNLIMKSERSIYLKDHPDERANGYYERYLNTKSDKIDINVPRTDTANFRPAILPDKYQRYVDDYMDLVVNLICAGNSKSQINFVLNANGQIYSDAAIEQIYNDLSQRLEDFKTRDLPAELAFVFIDGKYVWVKDNNKVREAVLYTIIGVGFDGSKQILGFYILQGSESAEKWKSIFNDLITRGLKKVLMFICDNLSGLRDTINNLFPKSEVQLCLVHLMRNSTRNLNKKDSKKINEILTTLKNSTGKSDDEYYKTKITDFIKDHKADLGYRPFLEKMEKDLNNYLTFLKFPFNLRKHIYSTNQIESVNNQIEKIRIRQGGYFQSMDNLELNIFILSNKLLMKWAKKLNPFFVCFAYEIRQLFNLNFSDEAYLKAA